MIRTLATLVAFAAIAACAYLVYQRVFCQEECRRLTVSRVHSCNPDTSSSGRTRLICNVAYSDGSTGIKNNAQEGDSVTVCSYTCGK